MSNDISKKTSLSEEKKLKELEDEMDFTLPEHYQERVNHHSKLLDYYTKKLYGTKST